jgi:putative DNA primase/helicase
VQTLLAKRDHDRPGNELAALRGVRFVSASEPAEGARLDVALVKALTGQDPITARFLFREFFTYTPEFKLWLMTNHRPVIRETTNAIWDRVKLIPFDVRFYAGDEDAPPGAHRQDPGLSSALRSELPGILAWAVRGCLEWQRDGLGEPEAVRAATGDYRRSKTPLAGSSTRSACATSRHSRHRMRSMRRIPRGLRTPENPNRRNCRRKCWERASQSMGLYTVGRVGDRKFGRGLESVCGLTIVRQSQKLPQRRQKRGRMRR